MNAVTAVLANGEAGYGVEYAWIGWGVCGAAAVGYVTWLLRRGRRTARQVPEGRRRWSDPGRAT